MNRMSDRNWGTRARHHEAQMALLRMIAELRITVDAGERMGTVQQRHIIETIHQHRPGIQECYDGFEDTLKTLDKPYNLMEDRLMRHIELVSWLNNLSVDVKLMSVPDAERLPLHRSRTIDTARLDEGKRLVNRLDECRERLVFYR